VFGSLVLGLFGAVGAGLYLGHWALGQTSQAQGELAVSEAQTQTVVLQDSDWLSEGYWQRKRQKKLQSRGRNNFSDNRVDARLNPFSEAALAETQKKAANGRRRGQSGNGSFFGGQSGEYRTVCVRLCDGYYFPVSFATRASRFEEDEKSCQSSCGTAAKLFYYPVADGSPETMVDRDGRAYEKLKTAFLYRTTYDATCSCKPAPWSEEARQQHAMYATKEWQQRSQRIAKLEAKNAKKVQRSSIAQLNTSVQGDGTEADVASVAGQVVGSSRGRVARSDKFRSGRMSLGRAPKQRSYSSSRSNRSGRPKWKSRILFGDD
jgi:hypothetical protein